MTPHKTDGFLDSSILSFFYNKIRKKPQFVLGNLLVFLGLLTFLGGCANSSTGKALEKSLSADPILKEKPVVLGSSTPTPSPSISPSITPQKVSLPPDFPPVIPRYPNSELVEIIPGENPPQSAQKLRWKTGDPGNLIQSFYQKELEKQKWQIITRPQPDGQGILKATQNQLVVSISLVSPPSQNSTTEFWLEYSQPSKEISVTPTPSLSPSPSPQSTPSISPSVTISPTPILETNLNDIPVELRGAVTDVLSLGVIKLANNNQLETVTSLPEPNSKITNREYARWLVDANNTIYGNRPAKKIRLGVKTSPPAFTDIPSTDPDFPVIQGLAEAGLIPSNLSGESKDIKFNPDQPLTREKMILWKVPLDTRQVLPTANLEAVKEKWGFQDASKIEPQSSRAVLADFNNGDLANIRRVFGFTTLFQPRKNVTRAEAAASLWYFGTQGDGLSAKDSLTTKGN